MLETNLSPPEEQQDLLITESSLHSRVQLWNRIKAIIKIIIKSEYFKDVIRGSGGSIIYGELSTMNKKNQKIDMRAVVVHLEY